MRRQGVDVALFEPARLGAEFHRPRDIARAFEQSQVIIGHGEGGIGRDRSFERGDRFGEVVFAFVFEPFDIIPVRLRRRRRDLGDREISFRRRLRRERKLAANDRTQAVHQCESRLPRLSGYFFGRQDYAGPDVDQSKR